MHAAMFYVVVHNVYDMITCALLYYNVMMYNIAVVRRQYTVGCCGSCAQTEM